MASKITGSIIDEEARIIVVEEDTWTIEHNDTHSVGSYEILSLSEGTKTIIARSSNGKSVAYGGVTAETYEITFTRNTTSDGYTKPNSEPYQLWTNGNVEFGHGLSANWGYFYFPNIEVPAGANLLSATFRYVAATQATSPSINTYTGFHNVANSWAPIDRDDILGRSMIQSTIEIPVHAAGQTISLNVSTRCGQILAKQDWAYGNNMMVQIRCATSSSTWGVRTAQNMSAQLEIVYN